VSLRDQRQDSSIVFNRADGMRRRLYRAMEKGKAPQCADTKRLVGEVAGSVIEPSLRAEP